MPFLAFRYRCPVRSFRSHLRDNRPFVRLAVLISEFPIIRKKIHLMLFLKKEIRHRSAKISRQSKLTFSLRKKNLSTTKQSTRKTIIHSQLFPQRLKSRTPPLRWSRLFLPTTCATMDRSGRTKSCLTCPILMFSPPSEFIPPGAILNFGDLADSFVTAGTIAANRSVGNCTHRPVR